VPAVDRQRQGGDAGGELEGDGWSGSHAATSKKTGQLVRAAVSSTRSWRQPSTSTARPAAAGGRPAAGVEQQVGLGLVEADPAPTRRHSDGMLGGGHGMLLVVAGPGGGHAPAGATTVTGA
jgi:hypothetical protein